MVVIGRGEGEIVHNVDVRRSAGPQEPQFADDKTVIELASRIAASNAELMRRLA